MGFIDRIGNILPKGIMSNANKDKTYFGQDFPFRALDKHCLTNDTYQIGPTQNRQSNSISNPITIDTLAIKHPGLFINRYVNEETIKNALNCNPNIKRILEENNLTTDFDINNVSSISMSHLIPTAKTAQKLYSKIGYKEQDLSYIHLTQAALLHDIGKAFIPKEILNKKGKLTPQERKIVELHNILSYEILKTTDLNPKVSQLALEHHDYQKNLKRTTENQCLTVADIYCALKEKRPYKRPISEMCAKAILYDMGTKGKFDTRYINYLSV